MNFEKNSDLIKYDKYLDFNLYNIFLFKINKFYKNTVYKFIFNFFFFNLKFILFNIQEKEFFLEVIIKNKLLYKNNDLFLIIFFIYLLFKYIFKYFNNKYLLITHIKKKLLLNHFLNDNTFFKRKIFKTILNYFSLFSFYSNDLMNFNIFLETVSYNYDNIYIKKELDLMWKKNLINKNVNDLKFQLLSFQNDGLFFFDDIFFTMFNNLSKNTDFKQIYFFLEIYFKHLFLKKYNIFNIKYKFLKFNLKNIIELRFKFLNNFFFFFKSDSILILKFFSKFFYMILFLYKKNFLDLNLIKNLKIFFFFLFKLKIKKLNK
jgi:hypothetical protein